MKDQNKLEALSRIVSYKQLFPWNPGKKRYHSN
jgi:hypothetical protein